MDFLDHRVPFLRVVPMVVWVEDAVDIHWIAVWREWIALDGQWERVSDAPRPMVGQGGVVGGGAVITDATSDGRLAILPAV
jgi:hypothetical protein